MNTHFNWKCYHRFEERAVAILQEFYLYEVDRVTVVTKFTMTLRVHIQIRHRIGYRMCRRMYSKYDDNFMGMQKHALIFSLWGLQ